jgi:hypothetical protein
MLQSDTRVETKYKIKEEKIFSALLVFPTLTSELEENVQNTLLYWIQLSLNTIMKSDAKSTGKTIQ